MRSNAAVHARVAPALQNEFGPRTGARRCGGSAVSPVRGGKRWSEAEEDELLWEVRSTLTVAEIAERHGRSHYSICARVATLVRDVREFERHEIDGYLHAFNWARDELRENATGLLAAQNTRADNATGLPYLEVAPSVKEPRHSSRHWVTSARSSEIAEVWASITGEPTSLVNGAAELDVLAGVERGV